MKIENYKTFLILAKTCNFSKTAEIMNVVQSTVSSRINEMEKELDTKLFERTNKFVKLTQKGESLLVYIKKINDINDEIISIAKYETEYKDKLRIAVPSSVYRGKLNNIIRSFYLNNTSYSLDIKFYKTDAQIDMLLEDKIDIGFLSRIPMTKKIIIKPFIEYKLLLVANKNYNIPKEIYLNQLKNYEIAYNNNNKIYNEWFYEIIRNSYYPRCTMTGTLELIDFVKRGYGCGFIPSYAIEEELKSGELRKVKINEISDRKFNIFMGINDKRKNDEVVKRFLNTFIIK